MMLDTVDYPILELLKNNSRLTYTDIGRAINMSSPAVKTRIERLEYEVIEGYTVNINHEALNQEVIRSTPSELEQISKDTTAFAFSNILSALGNYNVRNK